MTNGLLNNRLYTLLVFILFTSVCRAEKATITALNNSVNIAKIALPGGKVKRINPGQSITLPLTITTANGVEAKAWWVNKLRELCVIFVRYSGTIRINGSKTIRCLGN